MIKYSDINLFCSRLSNIDSRSQVDLSVKDLFPYKKLYFPMISAPMKDIGGWELCRAMHEYQAYGIIHRFQTIDEQVSAWSQAPSSGCAIGLGDSERYDRFEALYKAGCREFCLDVANGASKLVFNELSYYNKRFPEAYFIIGNFASFCPLWEIIKRVGNVVAARIGIAGGSACTTKNATGIYMEPAHLILCKKSTAEWDALYNIRKHDCLLIADGGIREPSDMCKALAIGYDLVMCGSVLANTREAPITRSPCGGVIYRGSASYDTQASYREPRYIEGRTVVLEYTGKSVQAVLKEYEEGLRSSMSYCDSMNLNEYRSKAEVIINENPGR